MKEDKHATKDGQPDAKDDSNALNSQALAARFSALGAAWLFVDTATEVVHKRLIDGSSFGEPATLLNIVHTGLYLFATILSYAVLAAGVILLLRWVFGTGLLRTLRQ